MFMGIFSTAFTSSHRIIPEQVSVEQPPYLKFAVEHILGLQCLGFMISHFMAAFLVTELHVLE
jgi:hypothetical protein